MPTEGVKLDHGLTKSAVEALDRMFKKPDPHQELMTELYSIRQQLKDLQLTVEYLTDRRQSTILTGSGVMDQYRALLGGSK